jgi:hypothetical protein
MIFGGIERTLKFLLLAGGVCGGPKFVLKLFGTKLTPRFHFPKRGQRRKPFVATRGAPLFRFPSRFGDFFRFP